MKSFKGLSAKPSHVTYNIVGKREPRGSIVGITANGCPATGGSGRSTTNMAERELRSIGEVLPLLAEQSSGEGGRGN